MPEDDENDFDLDLDLDLEPAPETPPESPKPPKPVATAPAQAPESQATPTRVTSEQQPTPAAFRKREPAPEPAPSPPTTQAQQKPAEVPAKFPPPRPAPIPEPPIQQAPPQPQPQQARPRFDPQPVPPQEQAQQAPRRPQPQPVPEQPQPPQAPQRAQPQAQPTPAAPPQQAPPTPKPKPVPAPAPAEVPSEPPVHAKNRLPEKQSAQTEAPADPFAEPKREAEEIVEQPPKPQKKRSLEKRLPKQKETKSKQKQKAHPSEESTGSLLRRKLLIGIPILVILAFVAIKFVLPKRPNHPKLNVDEIQFGSGNRSPKSSSPATSPVTQRREAQDLPPIDRSNETTYERDERAENTLTNFFNANKEESMLEYVRQPLRVAPLMRDYYSRKPFPPADERDFLGLKSDLQQADAIGPNFYSAEADLGRPRSHTMILEDTPKGFRVDWEYHVQYNPMDWSTFIKEAPTPPTAKPMDFRVYARIVPDYRYPFTDEQQYLGIELMTLNDTSAIIGYVSRGSELGKRMKEFLTDKAEELCILRLEFPSNAKPGATAVYIRELVNPHWIITNETSGY